MEFSLHAIRRPDVARLLVEHELRVRSELALLVTEALESAGRLPTVPVDELARMIVAVSEGSDIQALTDAAAGAVAHTDLGPRAVTGLLRHFSVPTESVIAPERGAPRDRHTGPAADGERGPSIATARTLPADFDPLASLDDLLSVVGLSRTEAGAAVSFAGTGSDRAGCAPARRLHRRPAHGRRRGGGGPAPAAGWAGAGPPPRPAPGRAHHQSGRLLAPDAER